MDTEALEETQSPETTNDEAPDEAQQPDAEAASASEPEAKAEDGTDEPKPDAEGSEEPKTDAKAAANTGLTLDLSEDAGPPPPTDTKAHAKWAEMRTKAREAERRAQEAEAKLAALQQPKTIAAGKEPELSDPEIGYDAARFKKEWTAWRKRQDAEDAAQTEQKKAHEKAQQSWKSDFDRYQASRANVPKALLEEAEAEILKTLTVAQQSALIEGSEDASRLMIALVQNPHALERLKSIESPAKFAAEIARLEPKVVEKNGKKAPPRPERTIRSGAESNANATLERLLKKAQETGDISEYTKYSESLERQKVKK